MQRPYEVGNTRASQLYPQMYTSLRALAITAVTGLLLANRSAAQKPEARPPGPPVEEAGPAGAPVPTARLDRADLEAWLDGYLP